jgi:uncharacterized protein (DUF1697 family)
VSRFVVLLRGINVGRSRRIGMGPLREALTAAGYTGVRTHLQSGNVVLDADRTAADLASDVTALVQQSFGFDVPVMVRTAPELAAVATADPLAGTVTDPTRYLVTFLPTVPDAARVAELPEPGPGEGAYRVVGRELYLWLPDGVLQTPVGSWRWDRLLGMTGTARNWNTVRALVDLAAGGDPVWER